MVDLGKKISHGSRVTLHFSLSLADEQVIDSNFNKEPASFKIGDGSLLPEFENLLIGEHEGAVIESTLPPKKLLVIRIRKIFSVLLLKNLPICLKMRFSRQKQEVS